MQLFILGIGLMLVFEGVLPFLAPRLWRLMMAHMLVQGDRKLRTFGLVSMLIGLVVVYLGR